jgi:hypothetical protein
MKYDDVEERSNIKHPFLEGTQHNLSSPPYLNLKEYNKLKNKVFTSLNLKEYNKLKNKVKTSRAALIKLIPLMRTIR